MNPRKRRKAEWESLRTAPPRDITLDTWNGRLTFSSGDAFMGEPLYVDRAYDRDVIVPIMAWLDRKWSLRKDAAGVLVDIGANIGMVTTTLLGQGWFARSVCFEPLAANVRLLRINVAQNGLEGRVTVREMALSSEEREGSMETTPGNTGDNRLSPPDNPAARDTSEPQQREVIRVDVGTLDGALSDVGVAASDVRLIWMDIMGHEAQCLQGARKTLAAGVPVVLELWPHALSRAGTTPDSFARLVAQHFTEVHRAVAGQMVSMPATAVRSLIAELDGPTDMAMILLTP